jgi:2-keto-4-pentenoate hydratase/2-oxohepta-3-ene-1,7-dioic acid hydratase in catechol pathway
MKLARVRGPEGPRLAVLTGDELQEIPGEGGALDVGDVLRGGSPMLAAIAAAVAGVAPRLFDLGELLAPLAAPPKVICVGQNYAAHAAESRFEVPAEPVIFSKFSSAVIGPADAVRLPSVAPRRVDYEAELAVVIGAGGREVSPADAMTLVGGYAVANDISARDWQLKKPAGQWLLGKSFDTFLPLGPAVVSADEVPDPRALRIICRIGGETLQDDVVGNMIFDIPTLISYVSQVATLEPGDVLLTGTPAGVGQSRVPPRWLQPGDVLETEISGIGVLRNPIVAA